MSGHGRAEGIGLSLPNRGLFRPTDIGNLILWTRPQGIVPNGSICGQWDNEGSDGGSFSQGVEDNQPAIVSAGLNDRDTLLFDGSNDSMEKVFGAALTQPFTVFLSARLKSVAVDQRLTASSVAAEWSGSYNNAGNVYRMQAGTLLDHSATPDTSFHVWSMLFNGVSSKIGIDGVSVGGDAGAGGATGISIGRNGANSAWGNVEISEVLVYDAGLSATEIAIVEAYLAV
jgi:hypothetical protein